MNYAQVIADFDDISIFFGDKQKSGSNVESLLKTESDQLICVQNELSFSNVFSRNNSKYAFNFITDYKIPEAHPITFYGNGKKSSLTHYSVLGDNILGISSQTAFLNKEQKLYFHFINLSSQGKSNHGFPVKDYFFINGEVDLSEITVVSSQDKNYASMIYIHESAPENYKNIKYLNFKNNSPLPQSGNFIYPFPPDEFEFLDFYIKDESTQYITSGHFLKNVTTKNWNQQSKYYKSITVGEIKNQKFSYVTIEDEGKFYSQLEVNNLSDQITISGLYASFIDANIEGVFTAKITEDGTIVDKQYSPFSNDVISTIATYNLDFLNDQNTIKNEYLGFEIIEFYATKDGYLGMAEFKALEYRYGSADVPGATNTVDSYYWSNDLIVFKINSDGHIVWDRTIPKYQRSINDGGYHLSSASYLDAKKLHIFFNDNLLNYDQDGDYNRNGDFPYATQFNAGKNTIAHVSLNLEDGFLERKSTIGKEETNLLFVPLLATPFPATKKLMIYGRTGNKQKLGSISFPD
ncbi:hypothetical protein DIT68_07055 [Brumimicrobium oceani]|uniref:Uncharacterized protein n=1 Tax=Brumimicrobium oceani TaxID=2100725 RepID=A0A2U2XDG8_9FLAO|nr:hypothetical protein DIT68_07055 [Brumimicrobium oceani]